MRFLTCPSAGMAQITPAPPAHHLGYRHSHTSFLLTQLSVR